MTNSIFTIKSPLTSTDSTLQKLYRDPLLDGVANDGVRFIADFGFGYSYPGGALTGRAAPATPVNGALVQDVSEHANGYVNLIGSEALTYAGGGISFANGVSSGYVGPGLISGSCLVIPASVAADIWSAYGGNSQQYLLTMYLKLPTLANWAAAGETAFPMTFSDYGGGVELAGFGFAPSASYLQAIYKSGVSTAKYVNMVGFDTVDCGQVAQLAFWRNASGTGLTLRTARARTTTLGIVNADVTTSFAAQKGKIGTANAYWGTATSPAKNFVLYRAFVENLARSGRAPLTVLEADWLRVVARGAFS